MDECITSLGKVRMFSKLRVNSVYWQVEIGSSDLEKTAFTSHDSIFKFTKISFDLNNSLATVQRATRTNLSSVRWKQALVYLNDISAFSKTVKADISVCGNF